MVNWRIIGPLQDPVTWYEICYTGTQVTQWDFQNKVPLRNMRPSVIYSVPCDRIVQRAYYEERLSGAYSVTETFH